MLVGRRLLGPLLRALLACTNGVAPVFRSNDVVAARWGTAAFVPAFVELPAGKVFDRRIDDNWAVNPVPGANTSVSRAGASCDVFRFGCKFGGLSESNFCKASGFGGTGRGGGCVRLSLPKAVNPSGLGSAWVDVEA